jgi:AcrR family transcriptional regulator
MTPREPRRADAQRNRGRLLTAAEAALNAHGASASLDDIARAAGVGNATLYRHFPTRADLIEAVYDQRIRQLCAAAAAQAEVREPATALREWLHALVAHITDSRVLADAFSAAYEGRAEIEPPQVAAWHSALFDAALPLLTAAQGAGAIRPDLTLMELMALTAAVARAGDPAHAERFLDVLLEGIIPRPGSGLSRAGGRHRDRACFLPLASRVVGWRRGFVGLAGGGQALELPCVHARQEILAVRRWAEPRVVGNSGVAQGVHVRPILVDPCACLISSAGGPVAGDEDIDVIRRALEQPQRGEVVLDRGGGVVQVEHRNQDIGKHVADDENPAFLNQQRRMAGGMRLMLDDPDVRAIPGNPRSFGGQAANEAEHVPRYLLDDIRRYPLGDASLPIRVRQLSSDSGRAAGRAVTRRRAEPGVPEQMIPMRMGGKPSHHGLAQLAKVVREGGHFAAVHPRVDEQHASPALHDNGVALDELALVDQHTVRDLPQHGWLPPLVVCNRSSRP